MPQDKFGGMNIGIINTGDIKPVDLKTMWKQVEGLMRDKQWIPDVRKDVLFVPKNEYEFFCRTSEKAATDKSGVMIVPIDYSNKFDRDIERLCTTIPVADISRLYELSEPEKHRIEIDTTDLPNERYHDRTFPNDYYKKKKAKRRLQKRARRKK